MANSLGLFIERRPANLRADADIPGFFSLMHSIAQNPSLFVSIPVLHCFSKLLKSRYIRPDDLAIIDQSFIVPLLEICCQRLIRYESFPEDSEDVTVLFLDEDVDTIPERHAFLGNYRRYCTDVVETVARKVPKDAILHILGQASNVLGNLYHDVPPFDAQNYSKASMACLRVDAQVTIVEAALKGYLKWVSDMGQDQQKEGTLRLEMEDSFEQWCRQLLHMRFEVCSPAVDGRALPLTVSRILRLQRRLSSCCLHSRRKLWFIGLDSRCPSWSICLLSNWRITLLLHSTRKLSRIWNVCAAWRCRSWL